MKKKIIYVLITAAISSATFLIGTTQAKPQTSTAGTVKEITKEIPEGYINTKSQNFINNYIDMREISDIIVTEKVITIYLTNGNYYYWER